LRDHVEIPEGKSCRNTWRKNQMIDFVSFGLGVITGICVEWILGKLLDALLERKREKNKKGE